jgi:predicted DNA-binding transcriptional regulator AlpA
VLNLKRNFMSIASTGLGKGEPGLIVRSTYTMDEVAALFGIGRNAAYASAARGDFPVIRLGKTLRAPKAAIDRMLGRGGEGA